MLGRFVAMDLLEKVSTIGSILSSNVTSMTDEETQKYRKFLQDELELKQNSKKKKKERKERRLA